MTPKEPGGADPALVFSQETFIGRIGNLPVIVYTDFSFKTIIPKAVFVLANVTLAAGGVLGRNCFLWGGEVGEEFRREVCKPSHPVQGQGHSWSVVVGTEVAGYRDS